MIMISDIKFLCESRTTLTVLCILDKLLNVNFYLIVFQLVSFMLDLQGEPKGLSIGELVVVHVTNGKTSQLPVRSYYRLIISMFFTKWRNKSATNVECLPSTILAVRKYTILKKKRTDFRLC